MFKRVKLSSGEILPNGYDNAPNGEPGADDTFSVLSAETVRVQFVDDDLTSPLLLPPGVVLLWDAKLRGALDAETATVTAGAFTLATDLSGIYTASVITADDPARALFAGGNGDDPVQLSGQFSWFAENETYPARSKRHTVYLANVVRNPDDQPPANSVPPYPSAADIAKAAEQADLAARFGVRNYAAEAKAEVDARIAGKTPGTATLAVYSSVNDSTRTYARNPSLWLGQDIDLTCISVASTATDFPGGWWVTAFTSRHCFANKHTTSLASGDPTGRIHVGTRIWWTDKNNVTTYADVAALTLVVGDLVVVTLDRDLPTTIAHAAVMPSDLARAYRTTAGDPSALKGSPVVTYNRNRHLCIALLDSVFAFSGDKEDTLTLPTSGPYAPWNRAASTPGTVDPGLDGDSGCPYFLILGGKPVFLGSFAAVNGFCPDWGGYAAAIRTIIGAGYALETVSLPAAPAAPRAINSLYFSSGYLVTGYTDGTVNPVIAPSASVDGTAINPASIGANTPGPVTCTTLSANGARIISGPETGITGATALDASAFGRSFVCTGTTSSYALTLPDPTGHAGELIRLRMASTLAVLVTIDAGAGRLIDGQQTRIMHDGESATLFCDGTGWSKVAGVTIPAAVTLRRTAAQTVGSTGAWTQIVLSTRLEGHALMHDTANGRVNILRAGTYQCAGFLQRAGGSTTDSFAINTTRNAVAPDASSGGNAASNAAFGGVNNTTYVTCAAGDWLALSTIFFGSAGDVLAVATAYPQLTVTERVSW